MRSSISPQKSRTVYWPHWSARSGRRRWRSRPRSRWPTPSRDYSKWRRRRICRSSPSSCCTRGRGFTPIRSTAAIAIRPAGRRSGSPVPARWRRRTPVVTPRCLTSLLERPRLVRRSLVAKPKPDSVDACIIGAGASGATAAKVLTESGLRVVMLERGPWRKPESFGGDELANVHRYNLWPDPILNPRTFRSSSDQTPQIELFCPVPQMVGGGTAHWTGWVLRMTENEFRPHTIYGNVSGANLADWPISYQELEPYYDRVEWAFGVSGEAGANKYEGPRSRGYPCPALPPTRYNQKFYEGCARLGYNAFPPPAAALSPPYNGRPAPVQSAFAQQHGDPTGTRSNMLTTFIPDALATGKLDLRPNAYVREITVDAQGRARSAVYQDEDGDVVEQEAAVFMLACGAVESARLLLMSRSGRFPNGLANSNDLVGRNATF